MAEKTIGIVAQQVDKKQMLKYCTVNTVTSETVIVIECMIKNSDSREEKCEVNFSTSCSCWVWWC
jgi:hypothetical protein